MNMTMRMIIMGMKGVQNDIAAHKRQRQPPRLGIAMTALLDNFVLHVVVTPPCSSCTYCTLLTGPNATHCTLTALY